MGRIIKESSLCHLHWQESFSVLRNFWARPGTHKDSYSICNRGLFPRGQKLQQRDANHLPPSRPILGKSGAMLPSNPSLMTFCLAKVRTSLPISIGKDLNESVHLLFHKPHISAFDWRNEKLRRKTIQDISLNILVKRTP